MGSARTFKRNPHDQIEERRNWQLLGIMVPLSTYDQIIPPTVNDDITQGWKVGSKWIDTATNVIYECSSNAVGDAKWQMMVGTHATAGGVASASDLDGALDYVGVVLDHGLSAGTIVRTILNDLVAAGGSLKGEFHLVFAALATAEAIT